MSQEAFNCFKEMFLIVNQKLDWIQKGDAIQNKGMGHSDNNDRVTDDGSNDNPFQDSDFQYRCKMLPQKLEGINSLWQFIIGAQDDEVAEQAMIFLVQLYIVSSIFSHQPNKFPLIESFC